MSLIIAEVGLAHDGSLGMAHAYIDAVAEAGADAVKFQCHIADAESWPDEPWRVKPEWPQDATRFDYWRRTSFTEKQWEGLAAHTHELDLEFICSPFSLEAVSLLEPLVNQWKVASGEVGHKALLRAIGDTRKPVLLSSGMSTHLEVAEARDALESRGVKVQLMQCTSKYPCPPEDIGLDLVKQWGGLSDHSGTIWPALAAVVLGAAVVEVHVCFSRDQWGFDVSSSITIDELSDLMDGVEFLEAAMEPFDKDRVSLSLVDMRRIFGDKWRKGA